MRKVAKRLLFWMAAAVLLVTGIFLSELIWGIGHYRDDMPNTGFYRGVVSANFSSIGDSPYSLRFRGETPLRWYWRLPTNFVYSHLQMEWYGESNGSNVVSLPSLAYQSSNSTGLLTRATLAAWLLGETNNAQVSKGDSQGTGAVFDYIQAAGLGTLPAPRHHGHHSEHLVHSSIVHFHVGLGVPWLVYFWIPIWVVIVARGKRLIRNHVS